MRELTITIDEQGNLLVDIKGYQGRSCDEVAHLIEEVLGQPPAETRLKPEYAVQPAPRVRPGQRPGA